MKNVYEKANKMYEFAKVGYAIADAAQATYTADTDGQKLAALGKFIKVAGEFVPPPLKPLESFLDFYAEACIKVGAQLDSLMAILQAQERQKPCIFRPGVMAKGWQLYNWFLKACMGQKLPAMDSTLRSLLKDNRSKLLQLTGSDPISKKWMGLVVDDEYARTWFAKPENWMVVQLMVYGYSDDGQPMCTCGRKEPGWECEFCDPAPDGVPMNSRFSN